MTKQITLGQLINKLETCNQNATIFYDFAGFIPYRFSSYRGFYDQLALGYRKFDPAYIDALASNTRRDKTSVSVSELLAHARETRGKTFEGYKGGHFTMDNNTPLWVANPGECHSTSISGIKSCGSIVYIKTKFYDPI